MSSPVLLGIDLGTSSLKTVVVDGDGRLLGRASREYPILIPRHEWAEQDPEAWLQAVLITTKESLAAAAVAPADVAAIGLSGQMHGTICLDGHGRLLRPAIIWPDQRCRPQVSQVYATLGRQRLGELTANPVHTGFTLPTWLWLREHEPEVSRQTAHLLLPKDWLRFRLTGEAGSEPSDASGTLLFDSARRRWSDELLAAFDIDPALLPPLGESAAVAGTLTAEMATGTDLLAGTPVVFGGSDQACQALGNGIIEPGVVSCTIGSGGQLLAPAWAPRHDPDLRLHLFCHVLPDRWYQMAAILTAGLALRWLRDNVIENLSFGQLADLAATVPPGAAGLTFLPYLAGERTPYGDAAAPGAMVGLTLQHGRAHLARAVMEGVVMALRLGLDLMVDLGVSVAQVVASGGATQHPLWLQLQADILERPIHGTETVEAAAVGAAMLAGIGAGVFSDGIDASRQVVRPSARVFTPQAENVAAYRTALDAYRRLYPALRGLAV